MEATEAELQNFENFVNMNYLAFSKILKKHDKCGATPERLWWDGRERWRGSHIWPKPHGMSSHTRV